MHGSDLSARLHRFTDALAWHRRIVTAMLVGVTVVASLVSLSPRAARTRAVWAASRDLPGGQPLTAADVVVQRLPAAAVPAGALVPGASLVGRLLAAPVRRGEPLTDVRLLGPSLLASMHRSGLVAIPVRVADGAAAAAVTRAGDVVDVLATGDLTGADPTPTPDVVAAAVTVLAVPARDGGGGDDAGLVVVAVTPEQAAAVAAAADTRRLTLVLRRS